MTTCIASPLLNVKVMDNTECSDELAIRGTDLAYLIYKVVEVEYIFLVLSKVIGFVFLQGIPRRNSFAKPVGYLCQPALDATAMNGIAKFQKPPNNYATQQLCVFAMSPISASSYGQFS